MRFVGNSRKEAGGSGECFCPALPETGKHKKQRTSSTHFYIDSEGHGAYILLFAVLF